MSLDRDFLCGFHAKNRTERNESEKREKKNPQSPFQVHNQKLDSDDS